MKYASGIEGEAVTFAAVEIEGHLLRTQIGALSLQYPVALHVKLAFLVELEPDITYPV